MSDGAKSARPYIEDVDLIQLFEILDDAIQARIQQLGNLCKNY